MPPPRGSTSLCLAIEASNPAIHADVALGYLPDAGGNPSTLIACEPLRQVARNEDDLLPAIARVFASARVVPQDLMGGRVAVSIGPGGYTSLRVACAAAKMIAEAAGARCVPVPTALVILRTMHATIAGRSVGVFLAGKDDSAHLTVFRAAHSLHSPNSQARLVSPDTLGDIDFDVAVGDRHVPAPIVERLTAAGVPLTPPRLSAAACLELGVLPDVDPAELVPLYPREPDAVTLWRKRAQGASPNM